MTSGAQFHAELADLVAQAQANISRAEAVAAGLTVAQFNWQPAPGIWSIAQCLAHLNVVNALDVPLIDTAVADARRRGITGAGPFRYGWLIRKWVASLEPPPKHKFRAPKAYVPPPNADPGETIEEYRRTNRRIQDLMHAAEGIDLARVKLRMPVLKFFKMPLGSRFALLVAHDRRHLWQAEQVRNAPAFPRE